MSKVKVADRVIAVIDPEGNNGHDTAAGVVTGVNSDGTCTVLAHCDTGDRRLTNVRVFDSRKEVDSQLDVYLVDIPKQPNADNTAKRDAVRTDVLRWITAAYVVVEGPKSVPSVSSSSSTSSSTSSPAKKTSPARKSSGRRTVTAVAPPKSPAAA